MSWPLLPVVARVKAAGWPSLWLPVFVLWPLIAAVFALALPLCVLVLAPRRSVVAAVAAVSALAAGFHMLCALHGTQITLTSGEHTTWDISLY